MTNDNHTCYTLLCIVVQQYNHQGWSFVSPQWYYSLRTYACSLDFETKWAHSVDNCFQQLHVLLLEDLYTSAVSILQLAPHVMTLTSMLYYALL